MFLFIHWKWCVCMRCITCMGVCTDLCVIHAPIRIPRGECIAAQEQHRRRECNALPSTMNPMHSPIQFLETLVRSSGRAAAEGFNPLLSLPQIHSACWLHSITCSRLLQLENIRSVWLASRPHTAIMSAQSEPIVTFCTFCGRLLRHLTGKIMSSFDYHSESPECAMHASISGMLLLFWKGKLTRDSPHKTLVGIKRKNNPVYRMDRC